MAVSRREICKGCDYSWYYDGWYCCDYREITGQLRHPICNSGPGCTVRKGEPEPELKPEPVLEMRRLQHRNVAWDTDKAIALYQEGKGISEIAQAVGQKPGCIRSYFKKRGLHCPDARKNRAYTWDTERAAEMFRQGKSVGEIAKAVGTSPNNVRKWLDRLELREIKNRS